MKLPEVILSVSLVTGAPVVAYAQTATDLNSQVTTMNNTTASQGQTNVINKISSDFSSFLGSDSTAVVTGLRNGTPITLNVDNDNREPNTRRVAGYDDHNERDYSANGSNGFRQRIHFARSGKAATEHSWHYPTDSGAVTGGADRRHDHSDHRHRCYGNDDHHQFTGNPHHAQSEHGMGTNCPEARL